MNSVGNFMSEILSWLASMGYLGTELISYIKPASFKLPRINVSGAAHFAQRVCQLDFVARASSDRLQRFKNGRG